MKKLMAFIMPLKAFAAMIFTGFMCLYMMTGVFCDVFLRQKFEYTIPFVFVLQGLVLSMLISVLWGVFFSKTIIKKWRFFLRHIMFELSLFVLLAICFLIFSVIPADWEKLWLVVSGTVMVGVTVLSGISEMYFKKTGKRYTEILKEYQSEQ